MYTYTTYVLWDRKVERPETKPLWGFPFLEINEKCISIFVYDKKNEPPKSKVSGGCKISKNGPLKMKLPGGVSSFRKLLRRG